jgi:hypothetical protein
MEQTATVATGLDVARLLKSDSLSASMRANLQRADVDNDGIVDVEELLKILESESALRRERKLLRRIVIALGVACILIVAAVVGLTYAVVHLSKDTSVQNDVLVSKDGLQPLSTASLQETIPLADLYQARSPSELDWLTHVTVPFDDGEAILQIQGVFLVPGERVRLDTASPAVSVEVTADGVTVTGDEKNSTAARRRLMGGDGASGSAHGQITGRTSGRSTGAGRKECTSGSDCESGSCLGAHNILGIQWATGYCVMKDKLPEGSPCESSFDCSTQYCKGTCKPQKELGEACEEDDECGFLDCGRSTADDGAKLVCCAAARYGGYDYCTGMAVGATCWSDNMCDSKYCQGNGGGLQRGKCQPISKSKGESCSKDEECANKACGRSTADDGAKLVCCESGATSTYGGYDYCTGMAVGATCWADDQCQSGKCKGNGGGTQKGSCSSVTKAVGEACDSNYECANKACGRSTADDGAKLVCCESGATSTYGGYDYCTGMAVGATCWADDQCQSGKCKGNGGGTQKGSCSSVTKAVGEACDSNYECANKACGRSTADDGAKLVCCESGATSTYGGYDYCTGMAVGATCWADDQCQSKYCQGNGGGLQRGKCQSTSKSKGESCSKDEECGSKACGRQTAADNAPLVCCDALESWAGYDYCNNMPAGSVCWSDDQCVSSASNCKGNGYGVQRGICS